MDSHDPAERRRAQNRMAQRRFRKRCQQRLTQSIALQTESSSSSTSALASESCLTWTSGDSGSHFLSLQPDILPDATDEAENSLFPEHISLDKLDAFLINENLFSPMTDHTHLSETSHSSSSVDFERRNTFPGFDVRQDASNDSESLAFSSNHPRSASLPTAPWESPLHIAAQKGYGGIVRILLEHNVDCNDMDSDGLTPLAHAIRGDHEAAVRLLLSHGARLDYTDGPGCSVFHCAVIHRREALLRLFASHCAADMALLDAFDSEGMTPLHRAVATNFEAGVRILLHHGASVHHRARKGQ